MAKEQCVTCTSRCKETGYCKILKIVVSRTNYFMNYIYGNPSIISTEEGAYAKN